MKKTLLRLALSCAVLLSSTFAFAGAKNTPMQAFIDREKSQHEFVPVTGLWQQSDRFAVSATEAFVSKAMVMDINTAVLSKLATEKPQAITLTVASPYGGTVEVELARFDFLSKDFKIAEKGANGTNMVSYTPGAYYRGVVKGVEGSMAAFSFFNGEAYGVYSTPDEGNTVIEPNTMAGAPANNYLVYQDKDMKIRPQGKCGVDGSAKPTKTTANKNVYSTCKDLEVFFKADYETYIDFSMNTTTLANYLTSVFNNIATLYRNEGIYVSIRYMEVNIASDAYQNPWWTESSDFLFEFANTQTDLHDADMAMLLSTRDGGMGGVAFLDQLCFGNPYSFSNINKIAPGGFPTYTWNVHMMTHEFGHTIGSPHTHDCEWNGNFTAIDACYPISGGCPNPVPAYPSGGGTIMSYCHFQSVGINFSKGFGQQPGDLVRDRVFNAPCAEIRLVKQPTATANETVIANRECTDDDNITWYWNDKNNVEEEDDVLAMKIRKAGSNIGNLDATGFDVRSATLAKYGTGQGYSIPMPKGTILKGTNVSMSRYWSINATTQPAGEVEVMFPITAKDMADVDGSAPNTTPLTNNDLVLYMAVNGKDGNPANGIPGAAATDIKLYNYGASATSKNWATEQYGDTILVKFNTRDLKGGGTLIYSYSQDPNAVGSVFSQGNIVLYPNPTHSVWNVWVPNTGSSSSFSLYTVDGRLVKQQMLNGDSLNEVDASQLAAGLYYYRISSETATYTGNLQKQ
jgi:hypothetical protein